MNPFLARLGFGAEDRVVILHADDVGMCQSSVSAFADLQAGGLACSGSVMVPCAWFQSVAALCRANPAIDMGVHLTLTAEWDKYRWAPINREANCVQLIDADGYLPRTVQHLWQQADIDAAFAEVNAQINRARAGGINVTHFDDHMGALSQPRWLERFVDLALSYRLPIRYERPNRIAATDNSWAADNARTLARAEAGGLPLFDRCVGLEAGSADQKLRQIEQSFSESPPGSLSILFAHPAHDTPELRAITPDWSSRASDFEVLSSGALRDSIDRAGLTVIGFSALHHAIVSNVT